MKILQCNFTVKECNYELLGTSLNDADSWQPWKSTSGRYGLFTLLSQK